LSRITSTNNDARIGQVVHEAQKELAGLREEIGRYKIVFDSARLIVGHEFIKPIMSISGYLELLEGGLGGAIGAKERRYVEKIRDGIAHLEELVRAFVQMLRIDYRADKINEVERVNLRAAVERVRKRFGEKAGLIKSEIDADLPPVWLRRNSIEVVLENLISNAIDHGGHAGPVTVRASMRADRRGGVHGRLLMVSVEDKGPGIPEDKMRDIFNPFYRIESRSDSPGLGLGLALVKSIITIMKGEIYVKSELGAGTNVTFTIPIPDKTDVQPDRIG
jgi:signal transduction histidine kinase